MSVLDRHFTLGSKAQFVTLGESAHGGLLAAGRGPHFAAGMVTNQEMRTGIRGS